MKFKTGAVIGFAVGYYLGTQAGRERHEQINRWINKVTESPTVQQATTKAKETVGLTRNGNGRPDVDLTSEFAEL